MEIFDTSRDQERRRETRTPVLHPAALRLLNHPERGWGRCRITDVSASGAGLVLFGPPWPRYQSELRLLVSLDAAGTVAPLEVAVRNASATVEGWLRVGVEFVVSDADQQAAAREWVSRLLSTT